ncbi:MAG: N-formylglutamate amidohydrolase [Janthinobacterium lividum]
MTRPSQLPSTLAEPLYHLACPERRSSPLIVASPHSGRDYPPQFVAASRLDYHALRRSEDCFVDRLFEGAIAQGLPILTADFPRAYCDVNREQWELDPDMFVDKLPAWCNTRTARVNAGFGTIARFVSSGEPIYRDKLSFAEADERIRTCWQPYHAVLSDLINETCTARGNCVLLDCHSMPSEPPRSGRRPEPHFILGDAHGTSCDPILPYAAQTFLEQHGFQVKRNDPYAGGYVTRHYGRPRNGVHVLQLEVSRGLYLDQQNYLPLPVFEQIQALMSSLLACLSKTSKLLVP